MKQIRIMAKPVSFFLTILMIIIFTPYQVVLAKMVTTETIIEVSRAHEARIYVNSVLARENVKAAMISHGVDMQEAKARVDSLSDAEVIRIADEIDKLPTGGNMGNIQPFPTWVGILILVVVAIVIYLFFSAVTPPTEVEKKSE